MKSFEVILVFSNLRMTRFMQSADVFRDFEIILGPPATATLTKKVNEKIIEAIRNGAETAGYGLVAIVGKEIHYRDPKVKSVGDGKKWCTADDYLNSLVQK